MSNLTETDSEEIACLNFFERLIESLQVVRIAAERVNWRDFEIASMVKQKKLNLLKPSYCWDTNLCIELKGVWCDCGAGDARASLRRQVAGDGGKGVEVSISAPSHSPRLEKVQLARPGVGFMTTLVIFKRLNSEETSAEKKWLTGGRVEVAEVAAGVVVNGGEVVADVGSTEVRC